MAGFTDYVLPSALTEEWRGGDGTLRVTNLTSSGQVVTVTVYKSSGSEVYELSTLGDSITVDLADVEHFELAASSYPCNVLYLFGNDDTAELLEAPRVIVQSGVVTISGTVTATVSGTVGVSAVAGVVNVAGSVVVTSVSSTVTVSGSVTSTVSGTVGVSAVAGTVNVSGSVTVSNTIAVSGTVAISSIAGSVSISGGSISISSVSGNVTIIPGVFTAGGQTVKKVAVTGTRVALASVSTPCKVVMIKARTGNAGTLYLGTSTVTADETATGGLQLEPGDMASFTTTDLAAIYINGTAGDGVSLMYWT